MSASGICCCGITLKTGAKTIAAILVMLDVFYFGILTYIFITNLNLIDNLTELDEHFSTTVPPAELSEIRSWVIGIFFVELLFVFVDFGMNISLGVAATKADHRKCKIWRKWTILVMVLSTLGLLYSIFRLNLTIATTIGTVMELLFDLYALTLVTALITDIQDYPAEYMQPLNPE